MGKRLRSRLAAVSRPLRSVRVRLTLWYLAIVALVFLVFVAVVSGTVVRDAQVAARDGLIATAQKVAATYSASDGRLHVDYPSTSAPYPPAKTQRSAYPLGPEDIALLLSPQGEILQSLGPIDDQTLTQLQNFIAGRMPADDSAAQPAYIRSLPIIAPDGRVISLSYSVSLTSITSQGRRVALLLIALPQQADRTLTALTPGLFLAGPLALLLAAVGGYWLATRAMRPVRLITRAAREIGETDLSRRLNINRRDELGELATTFDRMLGRLEAAFARQRQFTADASHELRMPLTIIGLEASRALSSPRTPEEYARILTTIQAENDAMARLVDDLLTLARADTADTDQAMPHFARVDLSDVALDVAERLAPLARRSGITLAVGDLPELPVLGDRDALARLLSNLIENAIKYTCGIGDHVRIASGRGDARREGRAWVRIEDDGLGIPAEHLPHIFERFYQVDAARGRERAVPIDPAQGDGASGGSGLGLAIAQWVAQAHDGEVCARSEVGGGATFEVWLPLLPGR